MKFAQKSIFTYVEILLQVARTRTYSMETMEKMLLTWIEDSQKQNMPLSSLRIKAQARAFYQKIKSEKTDLTEVEINETFNASQGWFYRFKCRTGLGNIQLISEKDSPDAEGWRIYQCDLCGIKMTSSNNLANHRKCVHEVTRNHICETCGKSFAYQTDLRNHRKFVHEGTRNHTCETCGKGFAYPRDLRKHNAKTHENETLIP